MTVAKNWLFYATFLAFIAWREVLGDEDVSEAIRSLREQVSALLDHRQQDYNALEGSLKRAIEKNTELYVLKNEIKQLRKEMISLRGGNGNGNGNEVKNERLRVRWLGSAVTELQGEVAQVLRARNASEELAERSRMRSELALLKGDVAAVGKGIRNLGGRISKIEAVLGTIRIDIAAVKERFSLLSRTCADIASQLSSVQIEVKSLRCVSSSINAANSMIEPEEVKQEAKGEETVRKRRHGYTKRRLESLERKIASTTESTQRLEKRIVAYETRELFDLSKRMKRLEKAQLELSRKVSNVSETAILTRSISESVDENQRDSLRTLREIVEANDSSTKRELLRLGVNAARKTAELSLTREELNNLRRTVQALSVSASKLQERSDRQQETIDRLNSNSGSSSFLSSFERFDNRYHPTVRENLTESCEQRAGNGLGLLETATGVKPMLVFCRQGWIVIARRIDGTVDFNRDWNDYALGFGSPLTEYWIGNEILHEITRDNCTSLRIDMFDVYGERWRAEYRLFAIDSKETGYRLRVYGYTGNATDALSYQNGMSFSTRDRDMDLSAIDCAKNYHGGWWFSRCQHANLNGKYSLGLGWFRSDTNRWMPIASSEMSVRTDFECQSR